MWGGYPLPKIKHLFAKITGAYIFSKIDLKDAYQQLVLNKQSQIFTTINTINIIKKKNFLDILAFLLT